MTRSRAAAIAIALLVLAVLWVGPVAAYRDWRDRDAHRLAAAELKLARDRALLAAPATRTPPVDEAAVLYPEKSASQSAALMQVALKHAAETARVEIEGLQVMQPAAMDGAIRIGIRLKGRADIAALNRLLYAIESARPMLYADNLQITASAAAAALEFQVDISGFKAGPPA